MLRNPFRVPAVERPQLSHRAAVELLARDVRVDLGRPLAIRSVGSTQVPCIVLAPEALFAVLVAALTLKTRPVGSLATIGTVTIGPALTTVLAVEPRTLTAITEGTPLSTIRTITVRATLAAIAEGTAIVTIPAIAIGTTISAIILVVARTIAAVTERPAFALPGRTVGPALPTIVATIPAVALIAGAVTLTTTCAPRRIVLVTSTVAEAARFTAGIVRTAEGTTRPIRAPASGATTRATKPPSALAAPEVLCHVVPFLVQTHLAAAAVAVRNRRLTSS
jgi:hypothetical protein